jgi:hypothetical protein
MDTIASTKQPAPNSMGSRHDFACGCCTPAVAVTMVVTAYCSMGGVVLHLQNNWLSEQPLRLQSIDSTCATSGTSKTPSWFLCRNKLPQRWVHKTLQMQLIWLPIHRHNARDPVQPSPWEGHCLGELRTLAKNFAAKTPRIRVLVLAGLSSRWLVKYIVGLWESGMEYGWTALHRAGLWRPAVEEAPDQATAAASCPFTRCLLFDLCVKE